MNTDEMREALAATIKHNGPMELARLKADAILAPDSPLNGHALIDGQVIDVRAALVALSRPLRLEATDDEFVPWGGTMEQTMRKVLASKGITGPLADLCARLAEEAGA